MKSRTLPALLLVAACSSEPAPEPAPTPTATVAAPRTLVAADLDPATLGAKIVGPKGTDPEFAIMTGGKEIARIVSFVACPKAMTSCDPAGLPEGTVLTYVHTIIPAPAAEPSAAPTPESTTTATATPSPTPSQLASSLFRMTRPAPGFKGALGYSRAEAEAALGDADPITVTVDEGQLIWRVTGGTGWKPGAPVTVWWQTTAPPAGPQDAFQLELLGTPATVKGPFPAAEKPVDPAHSR